MATLPISKLGVSITPGGICRVYVLVLLTTNNHYLSRVYGACIIWNGLPFRGVGGIALFHFLGAFNILHVHACSILPSQDGSLYIITVCANTKQAPNILCVILLFITDGLFSINFPSIFLNHHIMSVWKIMENYGKLNHHIFHTHIFSEGLTPPTGDASNSQCSTAQRQGSYFPADMYFTNRTLITARMTEDRFWVCCRWWFFLAHKMELTKNLRYATLPF